MRPFVIPVKVNDEEELYERFLPSGLAFSVQLTAYLEEYLTDWDFGRSIRLELYSEQKPDVERFRRVFDLLIKKLLRRTRKELAKENMNAMISLGLGLVVLGASFLLQDKISMTMMEILSAVGSFAAWGAAAGFIQTLPTLRHQRRMLKKIQKTDIVWRSMDKLKDAELNSEEDEEDDEDK